MFVQADETLDRREGGMGVGLTLVRSGLAALIEDEPDLALVDTGLPGLDGYAVARQARERLGDRVRLVALTGYGQQRDRAAVLAAGFDDHLIKPVTPAALTRVLRSIKSNS